MSSHSVTLKNIKKIHEVRLSPFGRVEFLITNKQTSSKEWLPDTRFASKTLSSACFVKFYRSHETGICKLQQLRDFLKRQKALSRLMAPAPAIHNNDSNRNASNHSSVGARGAREARDINNDPTEQSSSVNIAGSGLNSSNGQILRVSNESKESEASNGLDGEDGSGLNAASDHADDGGNPANEAESVTVTLAINGETQDFTVSQLKKLTFFKNMFSDRWMANRHDGNSSDPIDIFGDDADNSILFLFQHLGTLLMFVQLGKLPAWWNGDCHFLEGVIRCNSYCAGPEESVISEESLIKYFQNRKPRLSASERELWHFQATEPLLKSALEKYISQLNDKISQMRDNLVANYSKIPQILYDAETANAVFAKKFKIVCRNTTQSAEGMELSIHIEDFTSLQDYQNLWQRCKCDENLSIVEPICSLVRLMNNTCYDTTRSVRCEWDQCNVINAFVVRVIENIRQGQLCERQLSNEHNITLLDLIKVSYQLIHECKGYMVDPLSRYQPLFPMLEADQKCEFLNLFLHKHKQYFAVYQGSVDMRDQRVQQAQMNSQGQNMMSFNAELQRATNDLNQARSSLMKYYNLLRLCLVSCAASDEFIVKKVADWFPIVHENMNDSQNWILGQIVPCMSTQCAFDFGLYLTNYIAFSWNRMLPFPLGYLNFIKNDLSLDWVIPTQARQ